MRKLPSREDVGRVIGLREGRGDSMRARIRRRKEGPRKKEDSLRRSSGSNLEISICAKLLDEGHIKGCGEDDEEAFEGMYKKEKLIMQIHLPFAFIFHLLEIDFFLILKKVKTR